jgi:hypothetical protein
MHEKMTRSSANDKIQQIPYANVASKLHSWCQDFKMRLPGKARSDTTACCTMLIMPITSFFEVSIVIRGRSGLTLEFVFREKCRRKEKYAGSVPHTCRIL